MKNLFNSLTIILLVSNFVQVAGAIPDLEDRDLTQPVKHSPLPTVFVKDVVSRLNQQHNVTFRGREGWQWTIQKVTQAGDISTLPDCIENARYTFYKDKGDFEGVVGTKFFHSIDTKSSSIFIHVIGPISN